MAEALRANETSTGAAVSHEKKERRKFWNRVIGRSLLVVGAAIALASYVTLMAPAALITQVLSVTAGLGFTGGAIGTGVGAVFRGITELRK